MLLLAQTSRPTPAVLEARLLLAWSPPCRGEATPPSPITLSAPAHVACRLTSSDWSGPVRIGAHDPEPFAELVGAFSVTIALPEGAAEQGAFGSFELRGLHLDAAVARGDLAMSLKRATRVGGYVWTHEASSLRWTRAHAGRVGFEVALDSRVRSLHGSPAGEARCDELSLEPGPSVDYSAFEAWLRSFAPRASQWRGDERVPLALRPGAAPVAEIDTRASPDDQEPDAVYVLESRAQFRRVLYPLEGFSVSGWVPADTLQAVGEPIDASTLAGFPDPNPPLEPAGEGSPLRALEAADATAVCAWNAPLLVESGSQRYRVGRLASAIPLGLGTRRSGLAYVRFEHDALSYEATRVQFLVPESSLYACGGRDDYGYDVVQTRP